MFLTLLFLSCPLSLSLFRSTSCRNSCKFVSGRDRTRFASGRGAAAAGRGSFLGRGAAAARRGSLLGRGAAAARRGSCLDEVSRYPRESRRRPAVPPTRSVAAKVVRAAEEAAEPQAQGARAAAAAARADGALGLRLVQDGRGRARAGAERRGRALRDVRGEIRRGRRPARPRPGDGPLPLRRRGLRRRVRDDGRAQEPPALLRRRYRRPGRISKRAAAPPRRRGQSAETSRGAAAAATRTFRGDEFAAATRNVPRRRASRAAGTWRCDWCGCDSKAAGGRKNPGPNGSGTLCSPCGGRFRRPKSDVPASARAPKATKAADGGSWTPKAPKSRPPAAVGPQTCDACGATFETGGALAGHRRFCDGGTWRCAWCACKKSETHGRAPGPDGPATLCSTCGSRFRSGATGPPTIDADGKFVCDGCGRKHDTMGGLAAHRRSCDGGIWRCDWCARDAGAERRARPST